VLVQGAGARRQEVERGASFRSLWVRLLPHRRTGAVREGPEAGDAGDDLERVAVASIREALTAHLEGAGVRLTGAMWRVRSAPA
jgi:hypothetical protein